MMKKNDNRTVSGATRALRFYQRFADLGGTGDQLRALLKDDRLMRDWIKTLQDVPGMLEHGLFLKPRDQVRRIRELNERRGWGFTETDFRRALRTIPAWPKRRLVAVVLVPYLRAGTTPAEDFREFKDVPAPGWYRTYAELIGVLREGWYGPGIGLQDDPLCGIDRVRLLPGIEHVPGLRWEVIDLGADIGKDAAGCRSPKGSAHAGVLACMVLHPYWMKLVESDEVPGVNIVGYQVIGDRFPPEGTDKAEADAFWDHVPRVEYNGECDWERGEVVGRAGIYAVCSSSSVANPRFYGVRTGG